MADQTLMIVKPDAVAKNAIGQIIARVEGDGFVVRQLRMMHLSREQAEEFYDVHKERPFYGELVDFMTSGPAVPMGVTGTGTLSSRANGRRLTSAAGRPGSRGSREDPSRGGLNISESPPASKWLPGD